MIAVNPEALAVRPCLILAHADPLYAALASRAFRRQGWDVYPASAGPELRRLARMLQPSLVALDADLAGDSGWLTCDKLVRELPGTRVVLVAPRPTALEEHLAGFVGAFGLVDRAEGPGALLRLLEALPLPLPAAS